MPVSINVQLFNIFTVFKFVEHSQQYTLRELLVLSIYH